MAPERRRLGFRVASGVSEQADATTVVADSQQRAVQVAVDAVDVTALGALVPDALHRPAQRAGPCRPCFVAVQGTTVSLLLAAARTHTHMTSDAPPTHGEHSGYSSDYN